VDEQVFTVRAASVKVGAMHTTSPGPTTTDAGPATLSAKTRRKVLAAIANNSFCTLATTSPANRAHNAGVVYVAVDGTLWVHMRRTSRKARNIAANPHVGVCIPYRRLPAGPPFTVHFQARAALVPMDAPEVRPLLERGALKAIAGHGALDMTDACFVTITPNAAIHSYGPDAKVLDLIRDPLNNGAASFRLDDVAPAPRAAS